ncbi:MAG: hypothetical protein QM786_18230 [Breznakibacter sp.]
MKRIYCTVFKILILAFLLSSCKKIEEYNQKPELESLQQGLRTCTALGYCTSIAVSAIKGEALPDNVVHDQSTGLIYVHVDARYPLPFNRNIGDVIIAILPGNNGAGLMSVLFADIDILGGKTKLYGLYAVPFIDEGENGVTAMFLSQDIIVGNGSDTILNIGNITGIRFNEKIARLDREKTSDPFVAIKQNVWMINIDQNFSSDNIYDDDIVINGGGQIVEAKGASGGIVYHAMIDTRVNYSDCQLNPIDGYALSQNFKIGGNTFVDLGNSLLSFRKTCNGQAHVDISLGKYLGYNNKYIDLNLY